ncbi:MAG TPA: ABC transporter permease [Candidatus Limnocylindria bacterium]|jgi:ABC-2 type transport system permease protein|nr:ABC transporter permease [Candidatus Limnocylindria bacterium]
MRGLWPLTVANIKGFYRNRAALFWTLAFPVIFIVLFGSIFSGGTTRFDLAWVDEDGSPAAAQLRSGFEAIEILGLVDADEQSALEQMRAGDVDAVVVVPAGLGAMLARSEPVSLALYSDPSRQTASSALNQMVEQVVGAMNQRIAGVPPALVVETRPLQTQNISAAAYFVPSILAMALMQLGVFASIPLVAQREKQILKRLAATPLSRVTFVGANVAMRLLIAAVQTVLIVGIGAVLFGVTVIGDVLVVAGLIALGALAFLAVGYLIAARARTEESANAMTSVVQFPLMFLSGIFFPISFMPDWLQPVAALMPLTYLADALRQTMVGGAAYAPLWLDVAVLVGWMVGCFAIAARWFRWQ